MKAEQPSLKARRLVFIDETSVTTKMVRHYGRCPRGERLVAKVPHGHWKTMTFIAGLRADGLTAPYVIDGAMDGPAFLAYVEQVLAPTLDKGDVVFMDNLRTHKVEGVAEALKAVGAKVRYLPAYCTRPVKTTGLLDWARGQAAAAAASCACQCQGRSSPIRLAG